MPQDDTLPPLPVQDGVEFLHCPGFPGYCVGDDGSAWSCRRYGNRPPVIRFNREWRRPAHHQEPYLEAHMKQPPRRARAGDQCGYCGQALCQCVGERCCNDGVSREIVQCPRCKVCLVREADPPAKVAGNPQSFVPNQGGG